MDSQLRINPEEISGAMKRVWEFGFNTCHAPLVMRSDLQRQMSLAREQLRMKYWRCHGMFSDDVGIVSGVANGSLQYTFSGLKRILDAALTRGIRPFMELSFMPSLLARDDGETICHYRGIVSPPKHFVQWGELVEKTLRFLAETYGLAELRSWYFEVWNEPNIDFWRGTQLEYFELYRQAALAIKRVDSLLRVGGPATARAAWVKEFLRFCQTTGTPVDFISTHLYPSDVAFTESARGAVQLLGIDFLYEHFRCIQTEVTSMNPGLPIVWSEWNSSAGPFAVNHDDCSNSAIVAAALAGIEEYADGSLFWNLSDIYEEAQYHFAPFHGGYGLFTVDDIPKAAARTFELFARLGDRKLNVTGLPSSKEQGAVASLASNTRECAIVLWNHASVEWKLDLSVVSSVAQARLTSIKPARGSAYEAWLDQGAPGNLKSCQHNQLLQASKPETRAVLASNSGFKLNITPGTTVLLEVKID
jgi:xylan 1,4-beta-xylosidase